MGAHEGGVEGAIAAKTVTYDFARLMTGAKEVKCSEFGEAVIKGMDGKKGAKGTKGTRGTAKSAKRPVSKKAGKSRRR